jgi:hypothetical protein
MKKCILALIFVMLLGLFAEPAFAQRPSCDTSGTTIQFLGETCEDTTCTWEYEVCQTGFALSHWVLGRCACFESHITEVGYIDAQNNETVMSQCTGGQTTPCWEFGLDPTTGLFGLKWDNLPGPENECWTFYFKIDQDLGEATLNWTSKFAACAPGSGTVTGPACPCDCGQIIAFKYYDVDQDGVYDQGDYELEGWEICLDGTCKVTDKNGFVDFGCLAQGDYTVCETPKADWVNIEPGGDPPCYTRTLHAGEQIRLHFGNYEDDPPMAYIRASKYYDYNRNGQCDDPGCPLNDWEICLDGTCKTTSDICMLCGGCTDYWEVDPSIPHTLCEIPKAGWVNSDPGVDPPCKEVTVEPDEFLCVPFGNWESTVPVDEGDGRDRGVAVGGEVHQVNKVGVLAPWLILALIVVIGGSILVMIRYKTR